MANQSAVINQMRGQNMVLEREIMKIRQLLNSFERRIADLEIDVSSIMAPALDGPLHDEIVADSEDEGRTFPQAVEALKTMAVENVAPVPLGVVSEKPRHEVRRTRRGYAVFEGMERRSEIGTQDEADAAFKQLEARERS